MICMALKGAFLRTKKYLTTYEEVHLKPDSLRIMNIHWYIFISRFQKVQTTKMKKENK